MTNRGRTCSRSPPPTPSRSPAVRLHGGNNRTAHALAAVFPANNGIDHRASEDEVVAVTIALADGSPVRGRIRGLVTIFLVIRARPGPGFSQSSVRPQAWSNRTNPSIRSTGRAPRAPGRPAHRQPDLASGGDMACALVLVARDGRQRLVRPTDRIGPLGAGVEPKRRLVALARAVLVLSAPARCRPGSRCSSPRPARRRPGDRAAAPPRSARARRPGPSAPARCRPGS